MNPRVESIAVEVICRTTVDIMAESGGPNRKPPSVHLQLGLMSFVSNTTFQHTIVGLHGSEDGST